MAKIKTNISIDGEVWKRAGEMLKAVGLNRSAFIEITFRSFVKVNKVPIPDLFKEVVDGLQEVQDMTKVESVKGAVKKKKTKG